MSLGGFSKCISSCLYQFSLFPVMGSPRLGVPLWKFLKVLSNITRFWLGDPFCCCDFFQIKRFYLSMNNLLPRNGIMPRKPFGVKAVVRLPQVPELNGIVPPQNIPLNNICHKTFYVNYSKYSPFRHTTYLGLLNSQYVLLSIRAHTTVVNASLRNWNVKLDIYIQSRSYIKLSFTYYERKVACMFKNPMVCFPKQNGCGVPYW